MSAEFLKFKLFHCNFIRKPRHFSDFFANSSHFMLCHCRKNNLRFCHLSLFRIWQIRKKFFNEQISSQFANRWIPLDCIIILIHLCSHANIEKKKFKKKKHFVTLQIYIPFFVCLVLVAFLCVSIWIWLWWFHRKPSDSCHLYVAKAYWHATVYVQYTHSRILIWMEKKKFHCTILTFTCCFAATMLSFPNHQHNMYD